MTGIDYKKNHVLTVAILNLIILIITFLTDNPVILTMFFAMNIVVFKTSNNLRKLANNIKYFIPMAIIVAFINIIFIPNGNTIMFTLFNRKFTLEALTYGLIFSFKLFLIICTFMLIGIMVDSDRAASYFSSIMPKSTLTLIISLKLFPNMQQRLKNLKEVYSIRGVSFEGKNLKDKIKCYIPVFSILLEDSLEGAFDIGEAAYVKGFLSGKRSVYDRQTLKYGDFILILQSLMLMAAFIILKIDGIIEFDVYNDFGFGSIVNIGNLIISILIVTICVTTYAINKNS